METRAIAEAGCGRHQDPGRHGDNLFGGMLFTERNFDILDVLRGVAEETGHAMAQGALAWVVQRGGVSSVLVGASRAEQLKQSIASLDVVFTPQQQRLDEARQMPGFNPSFIFQLPPQMTFGAEHMQGWRAG